MSGTLDQTFTATVNGSIYQLLPDYSGRLLLIGGFTQVNSNLRYYIARLAYPDWNDLDRTFANVWDAPSVHTPLALALDPDARIVLGGDFTAAGGYPRGHMAMLWDDGSVVAFNPATDAAVSTVAVLPRGGGYVVMGGSFTTVSNTSRPFIARTDLGGGLDTSFSPAPDRTVGRVWIDPNNKILISGNFTHVSNHDHDNIARLNTDGSLDPTFLAQADGVAYAAAFQSDGKIVLGGNFAVINGQARKYIARLNTDGSLDTSFNASADKDVKALAIQDDGKVLLGGNFSQINGQAHSHIARLNTDGSVDSAFTASTDDRVTAFALQPDQQGVVNKVVIGGDFQQVNNTPRISLARLWLNQ